MQEGEIAKVGDGLCVIETEEEASEHSDASTASPVDELSHQDQTRAASNPQAVSEDPRVARRSHPLDPNGPPAPEFKASSPQGAVQDVLALPAVRHFARQSGVDLAVLAPGSGKNGRVERVDVERYLNRGQSAGEQPCPAISEEDVVVELGRTRYGMWKAMEKVRDQPRTSCMRFHDSHCLSFRACRSHILGECSHLGQTCATDMNPVILPLSTLLRCITFSPSSIRTYPSTIFHHHRSNRPRLSSLLHRSYPYLQSISRLHQAPMTR